MYENGPAAPRSPSELQRPIPRAADHPSYQNTAYTGSDAEPDGPTLSSAPSSAYYSDLSSNSTNQQQLPTVTTTTNLHQALEPAPTYRLAAINETTVPSDYI